MTGAATGAAAVSPGVAPRRRWRHAGASPCGAAVWGGRARPRGRRASRRGARAGEAGHRRQPRPWTLGGRRGSPSRPGAARGGSSGGDGRLARGGHAGGADEPEGAFGEAAAQGGGVAQPPGDALPWRGGGRGGPPRAPAAGGRPPGHARRSPPPPSARALSRPLRRRGRRAAMARGRAGSS